MGTSRTAHLLPPQAYTGTPRCVFVVVEAVLDRHGAVPLLQDVRSKGVVQLPALLALLVVFGLWERHDGRQNAAML